MMANRIEGGGGGGLYQSRQTGSVGQERAITDTVSYRYKVGTLISFAVLPSLVDASAHHRVLDRVVYRLSSGGDPDLAIAGQTQRESERGQLELTRRAHRGTYIE